MVLRWWAWQPCPADDSDTHTGSYEADFRLLKTDLAASFNQWRRHLAFREEGFANGGGGGGGTTTGNSRGAEGGEGRSAYGLSKGKEIRYHTYEVGANLCCAMHTHTVCFVLLCCYVCLVFFTLGSVVCFCVAV